MDNFKVMYRILKALEAALDFSEFDISQISTEALGITPERLNSLLEMMLDEGLITGLAVRKYVTGATTIDASGIKITIKGLEYLEENSLMRKIHNAAKGIADIIP